MKFKDDFYKEDLGKYKLGDRSYTEVEFDSMFDKIENKRKLLIKRVDGNNPWKDKEPFEIHKKTCWEKMKKIPTDYIDRIVALRIKKDQGRGFFCSKEKLHEIFRIDNFDNVVMHNDVTGTKSLFHATKKIPDQHELSTVALSLSFERSTRFKFGDILYGVGTTWTKSTLKKSSEYLNNTGTRSNSNSFGIKVGYAYGYML